VLIYTLSGLDNSHFWNIKQDMCGITTFTYRGQKKYDIVKLVEWKAKEGDGWKRATSSGGTPKKRLGLKH